VLRKRFLDLYQGSNKDMSDKKFVRDNIQLIVRQREKVLFQGEAKAFTSYNEKGLFDVLATHANFISIINRNFVIHKLDGEKSEIKINEGIIRVNKNEISVYMGIGG
jgi:F0F1-type ATP synthase epsilon subunit